jgi:hypothetical protein
MLSGEVFSLNILYLWDLLMPFSSNMKTSLKSVRAGCCLLVSILPPLMHGSTRPSSRPSERLWKSRSCLANPDVVWLIQMNNNITKYNWFFHEYKHVNSWYQIKNFLYAVNANLIWYKALLNGTVWHAWINTVIKSAIREALEIQKLSCKSRSCSAFPYKQQYN